MTCQRSEAVYELEAKPPSRKVKRIDDADVRAFALERLRATFGFIASLY